MVQTTFREYTFHRGTAKARLRPVERKDWGMIVTWWNNPELKRLYDMHFMDQTFADAEKWFTRQGLQEDERKARSFVIEVEKDGKWIPVGTAEFFNERPSHRTAEFGFLIGEKDWWGKGLGTETARAMLKYGFQELNYHRIGAVSAAYNIRSLNALKKAGFQIEGVRRDYVLRDGEYHDQIMMAVLKKDYQH